MQGAMTLVQGVLWIARSGARAALVPFDLDGRPLGRGFRVRGFDGARVELAALSADADRRLWCADPAGRAVRGFSVFGSELFTWRDTSPHELDRAGHLGRPAGIAASGVEDELRLLVASGGERRHALHWVDPDARTASSLRPLGDPSGAFRGLAGVAVAGRLAAACEPGAARVQVFRDGEFHFAFRCPPAPGWAEPFDPRAIAFLPDGRMVVAHGGESSAVLVFGGDGRFERLLAEAHSDAGGLVEPTAVAVEPGASAAETRVPVMDLGGERVQVFTLDGRCLGAFLDAAQATT